MSSSGQIIFASTSGGVVWYSQNSGSTWSKTGSPSTGWLQITCSEGAPQYVAGITSNGKQIYYSTNTGASWALPLAVPAVSRWNSVAYSGNGAYLIASMQAQTNSNGGIYYSTNYGATWTLAGAPTTNIFYPSVAINYDGSYMFASEYNYTNGKKAQPSIVYRSTNFGVSWSATTPPPIGSSFYFTTIVSDNSGEFLFTVVNKKTLYLGFDYGMNWTFLTVNDNPWNSLATSSTGKYVAATTSQDVRLSEDYGVTWNTQTIKSSNIGCLWAPIALNGSGLYSVVAQTNNGGIYLGTYSSSKNASVPLTTNNLRGSNDLELNA